MNGVIAINIIINDCIKNNRNMPILFYWDGEKNIKTVLFEDDDSLLNIIIPHITDFSLYYNAQINCCGFVEENSAYTENSIYVRDIYLLDKFNDDIWVDIIEPIFEYLYEHAYKTQYITNVVKLKNTDIITDIYTKLKEKLGDKISTQTIIKYIKSKLDKNDKLSIDNKTVIISKLNNLLIENETE